MVNTELLGPICASVVPGPHHPGTWHTVSQGSQPVCPFLQSQVQLRGSTMQNMMRERGKPAPCQGLLMPRRQL